VFLAAPKDEAILDRKLIEYMTTLLNIDNHTKKFEEYPEGVLVFASANEMTLHPIESLRGQALALMTQPEVRGKQHLGKEEAVKFFQNIGMTTSNAIRLFNKASGFKRIKMRGYYCLQYPYVKDTRIL